ncbi:glycosyl transferase [Parapedobacter defluvii]|uniref:Glycosyl transferase n=1 Tax=Parapedobacter defluvii TaxID=2045106 RepID=A0ABQ1LYV8_9SPHI|nr:glycosyl transferase [Parapedobacter defluvii]
MQTNNKLKTNHQLSIITVNLNNKEGLSKTLASIANQSCQDFEYIVIDGSSTDGSVALMQNTSFIDRWISEKDTGVYDAMNKGIALATGSYLLFLNSGDQLFDHTVIENAMPKLTGEAIIYGNLKQVWTDTYRIHYFPEKLTFGHFLNQTIGHLSTFIRSDLFEKYGLYETEYKIVADWAFFTKVIVKENVSVKYIPDVVGTFDMNGMSSDPVNFEQINRERRQFLRKHFGRFLDDYEQHEHTLQILKRIQSSKGFRWLKALGVKKFQ